MPSFHLDGLLAGKPQHVTYKAYLKRGSWKCPNSPDTGAHHWILSGASVGVCQWCQSKRNFRQEFEDDMYKVASARIRRGLERKRNNNHK